MGRMYSATNLIIHEIILTCNLTTDERNIILLHRGTASGGTAVTV